MHSNPWKKIWIATAGLALVLSGCGPTDVRSVQAQDGVRQQLGPPAPIDTITPAQLSGAFRAAAARAMPAVVSITVTSTVTQTSQWMPDIPPELRQWFRIPQDPEPRPREGQGSGFIFDPRGYIMTNNHVVENAEAVRVKLADGREYDAEVVGGDANTDVAVVKIEPRNGETLPVAELGNSEELLVGDWVLALGNPLGLDFTVTAGIVSAKGRSIGILGPSTAQRPILEAFIQTDAAINPGNSGGPLVDLMGRVVGINSAIASQTGLNAGYGFAIPIQLARRIAGDLIEYGVVRRPRLGVNIEPVTEADAERYRLPEISGVHIVAVEPGTAAESAGIRMGDVVVAVDGKPTKQVAELQTELANRRPGDRVRLTVYRDGRPMEIDVRLGEFETVAARTPSRPSRSSTEQVLGFRAAPSREYDGIEIQSLVPGSTAQARGVPTGHIIVSINGQPVRSMEDLDRIAAGLESGEIVSLVLRNPQTGQQSVRNYRIR